LDAAIIEPATFKQIAVSSREHQVLVIPLQEDIPIRVSSLELDEKLNDALAIWPAIDVVAEEHISHRSAGGIIVTTTDNFGEFVHAAMEVADCVSESHEKLALM
jgi:hypothetical protein